MPHPAEIVFVSSECRREKKRKSEREKEREQLFGKGIAGDRGRGRGLGLVGFARGKRTGIPRGEFLEYQREDAPSRRNERRGGVQLNRADLTVSTVSSDLGCQVPRREAPVLTARHAKSRGPICARRYCGQIRARVATRCIMLEREQGARDASCESSRGSEMRDTRPSVSDNARTRGIIQSTESDRLPNLHAITRDR